MNKHQERKMAMLERIDIFLSKNPITPAIPRATALTTDLKGALTAMRAQGGDQQGGFGEFKDGASRRKTLASRVLGEIRDISETMTSLDPTDFPGVAEQFRLPKVRSYQRLLDTARAFLAALEPVKAALVQRGFAADFDETLQGLVSDFDAGTDIKHAGLQKQRTNTAALALTEEEVRLKARELDAIVSKVLKTNNPALLASWKSSVRVYSAPHRHHDGQTAAAGGTGGTGGGAGASAGGGSSTPAAGAPAPAA
jgi:hypothetical protein